jgi:hypothetical protein
MKTEFEQQKEAWLEFLVKYIEVDPFTFMELSEIPIPEPPDNSRYSLIIVPKGITPEILEDKLLKKFGSKAKHFLSDPDIDPRHIATFSITKDSLIARDEIPELITWEERTAKEKSYALLTHRTPHCIKRFRDVNDVSGTMTLTEYLLWWFFVNTHHDDISLYYPITILASKTQSNLYPVLQNVNVRTALMYNDITDNEFDNLKIREVIL